MTRGGVITAYLFDHTWRNARRSGWDLALRTAFGEAYGGGRWEGGGPPSACRPFDNPRAIVFVHTSFRGDWAAKADAIRCHIVLVRGAGGEGKSTNKNGNLHGCSWGPDEFVNLARNQKLGKFVAQVLKGGKIDWNLLLPNDDSLLALHLMCQGFLAAEARGRGKVFWGENEKLFEDLLKAAEKEVGRTNSLIGKIKASVKGRMPARGGVTVALRALAEELGYPDAP